MTSVDALIRVKFQAKGVRSDAIQPFGIFVTKKNSFELERGFFLRIDDNSNSLLQKRLGLLISDHLD